MLGIISAYKFIRFGCNKTKDFKIVKTREKQMAIVVGFVARFVYWCLCCTKLSLKRISFEVNGINYHKLFGLALCGNSELNA